MKRNTEIDIVMAVKKHEGCNVTDMVNSDHNMSKATLFNT